MVVADNATDNLCSQLFGLWHFWIDLGTIDQVEVEETKCSVVPMLRFEHFYHLHLLGKRSPCFLLLWQPAIRWQQLTACRLYHYWIQRKRFNVPVSAVSYEMYFLLSFLFTFSSPRQQVSAHIIEIWDQ